ncbi:hypothetical protein [Streptomyces xanthochromogenes]
MFELTVAHGDRLTIRRSQTPTGPCIALEVNDGLPAHIPLDHLEEVIAGMRDAARQAAALQPAPPEPVPDTYVVIVPRIPASLGGRSDD